MNSACANALGCTHMAGAYFGVSVICQPKVIFKKEEVNFGVPVSPPNKIYGVILMFTFKKFML